MSVHTAVVVAVSQTDPNATTLRTVPADQTWILKHAIVQTPVGAVGNLRVWVRRPSTGALGYIFNQTVTSNQNLQWQGWVVAGPGDEVRIAAADTPCQLWISGSQLSGVAA
jgi:hypothetical protein